MTRPDSVSKAITAIGKAAGVKVNVDPRTGRVSYAGAHDLRWSFAERWAARVMPAVLMELMRHESIETTLKYYVARNAQSTARTLWEAHKAVQGNNLGNTTPNTADSAIGASDISAGRA